MTSRLGRVTTVMGNADARIFISTTAGPDLHLPTFKGLAQAGPGMLYLFSVLPSAFHDTTVTMESWSGPPPAPQPDWEEHQQLMWDLPGAGVYVSAAMERPVGDTLALTRAGLHTIDVYANGRQQIQALRRTQDPEELPADIEQFLVQFWPNP